MQEFCLSSQYTLIEPNFLVQRFMELDIIIIAELPLVFGGEVHKNNIQQCKWMLLHVLHVRAQIL